MSEGWTAEEPRWLVKPPAHRYRSFTFEIFVSNVRLQFKFRRLVPPVAFLLKAEDERQLAVVLTELFILLLISQVYCQFCALACV